MLETLNPNQKHDWKSHVATMEHAYNCTRHDTTGMSPYYLLFGREPQIPVDIIFDLNKSEKILNTKYIKALKERLESAYKLAIASSRKQQTQQKQHYDLKSRNAILDIGDKVLKIVA